MSVPTFSQDFIASPSNFKAGDKVRYVPNHAHGDIGHKDCEDGVVTSCNEKFVFVRYGNRTGSQATSPDDLWSKDL